MCERNIHWLPLARPQLGTGPATQACALTRNQTHNLSVCGRMPNPLRCTSQGSTHVLVRASLFFMILSLRLSVKHKLLIRPQLNYLGDQGQQKGSNYIHLKVT